MKIKLIHKEWNDYAILDLNNNKLYRIKINNEYGSFILYENLITILWDKWDKEIFICYNNDNIYYLCTEINFVHHDWEDLCYIDYENKIITQKTNRYKGFIEFDNNNEEITIKWDNNMLKNITDNNILKNKINNVENHLLENLVEDHLLDHVNNHVIDQVEMIENKIPNILHFIYGFKEQMEEFELYRYIALKSAFEVNKPDKIYFYYYYEPFGYWWNKAKEFLTLEKVELPNEIYGNKLYHYAHKADIVRLKKLIERGGIYLDIDTICLKSFKDLLKYDFIMGEQSNCDNTTVYGLCNAIILSKPNSLFANKWLDSYKTFRSKGRDQYWDEHSVLKPLELSKIYKEDIIILNSNIFFYPLWYSIDKILFSENIDIEEYKKIIENNYCIHLWDTYSNKYLKTLNEEIILTKNTLYNIFSRKFIRNKISIVMLTYNRLDITINCLESYLKCLDNEYIEELIIFDNNSDLDLIHFLYEFQKKHSKIKIFLSDDNLGVCGGRMILFNKAIGDIIISLDSDAYLIDNCFFEKIIEFLYDERYGIIGISGAFIKSWDFGKQEDIRDNDENEYIVDHIAGCCQTFRKDLFHFGFGLDSYYGKFWCEDTDLSMQILEFKKINYRIPQKNYIKHNWGGSGKDFKDLFVKNWDYFSKKWKYRVLKNLL